MYMLSFTSTGREELTKSWINEVVFWFVNEIAHAIAVVILRGPNFYWLVDGAINVGQ